AQRDYFGAHMYELMDKPGTFLHTNWTGTGGNESWRIISAAGILLGIPTPAFSTALAFYDGFRCKVLPANLIQAQRDYFGAHMYELMDKPGTFLHTNWTGTGGNVTSTAYIQ
ncbi:6-phosphogluconate dehydrogenase, partial [Wuchereria bancrofti]